MNETGRWQDIRAEAVPLDATAGALRALRQKHGEDSLVGRLCKTLASAIRNLPGHVTPTWATHESQTLQGKIRWQLAQLEAALQGR